jgi:hypothetical protein
MVRWMTIATPPASPVRTRRAEQQPAGARRHVQRRRRAGGVVKRLPAADRGERADGQRDGGRRRGTVAGQRLEATTYSAC